jgi:hypothetical protein
VATRIDRRNQAHGVAGASRLNDRRCAAFASSAPLREIGTDLRGVGDVGFFPARESLNPREFWWSPPNHGAAAGPRPRRVRARCKGVSAGDTALRQQPLHRIGG